MIQLHRLEGFYWVCKAGGYAKAARAFPYPITQPAVHQQVKKLEQDLGLTLFERVAKDRMLPTPAGRTLFDFVAPFFEHLDSVLRALKSGDYGGELHIDAQGILLRELLPSWLKRLKRKRPDVRIMLSEMVTFDVSRLRNGEADVVVAFLPEIPDDIASQRIGTVYPCLVLPRDHPLAGRKRLRIEDLAGESFLSFHPGNLAHDIQMQVLRDHGVVPTEVISVGSSDTILGFVEVGLGYSLVPSLDPKGIRLRGVVARPLAGLARYPVVVAWRKDAPENVLLDTMIETAPKPDVA